MMFFIYFFLRKLTLRSLHFLEFYHLIFLLAFITQVVRYGSESKKSHRVKAELCRINGAGIKPGKRQCWCTKGIEVPSVPPSGLDGCKFIDVHYEVVVSIFINVCDLTYLSSLCRQYILMWMVNKR